MQTCSKRMEFATWLVQSIPTSAPVPKPWGMPRLNDSGQTVSCSFLDSSCSLYLPVLSALYSSLTCATTQPRHWMSTSVWKRSPSAIFVRSMACISMETVKQFQQVPAGSRVRGALHLLHVSFRFLPVLDGAQRVRGLVHAFRHGA